jgi:hypothetical protein
VNQVILRQISRGKLKSVKDKVALLGHTFPITEALFTNDVSNQTASLRICKTWLQNKGLCSFAQDGSILLWDVGKASAQGLDLKDLPKRNKMYAAMPSTILCRRPLHVC